MKVATGFFPQRVCLLSRVGHGACWLRAACGCGCSAAAPFAACMLSPRVRAPCRRQQRRRGVVQPAMDLGRRAGARRQARRSDTGARREGACSCVHSARTPRRAETSARRAWLRLRRVATRRGQTSVWLRCQRCFQALTRRCCAFASGTCRASCSSTTARWRVASWSSGARCRRGWTLGDWQRSGRCCCCLLRPALTCQRRWQRWLPRCQPLRLRRDASRLSSPLSRASLMPRQCVKCWMSLRASRRRRTPLACWQQTRRCYTRRGGLLRGGTQTTSALP